MFNMLKLFLRVVVRKAVVGIFFGRRRSMFFVLLATFVFVWYLCGWLITITSNALLPPPPPDQNLDHFRRNRSLAHYMDNIQVLVEPSTTPCASADEVPVIILVSSAPLNFKNRQAVRTTWGKHQPTFFVMGLKGNNVDEQLVDNYIEAKQYGDLVVFELHDHYQNLTLKTALMIRWALKNCPQAEFMFKTDDDVLVNPWTLKLVLKDNPDAALLGYKIQDTLVHRDEYTKWYMPRWLYTSDIVPQYLSGTGYIINELYQNAVSSYKDTGYSLVQPAPDFDAIKSGLFRKRNKSLGIPKMIHDNVANIVIPNKFDDFLLADYNCDGVRIILFCSIESGLKMRQLKHFFKLSVYLEKIFKKAFKVPLVNLEDIYFTYLVAFKTLHLPLNHDRRLNPHKPWLRLGCAYWSLALVHSLSPDEMVTVWSKLKYIANQDNTTCDFFKTYLDSELLLY